MTVTVLNNVRYKNINVKCYCKALAGLSFGRFILSFLESNGCTFCIHIIQSCVLKSLIMALNDSKWTPSLSRLLFLLSLGKRSQNDCRYNSTYSAAGDAFKGRKKTRHALTYKCWA